MQIDRLGELLDESNQQRLRVAREENRVLAENNKQQAACIRQLHDDLEKQAAMHRKHDGDVSKQVQRMKRNYKILFERFQKHRSKDFEVWIVPR